VLILGLVIGGIASLTHPSPLPLFSEAQREAAQGFWNEILGRPAHIEIRDQLSGRVYAASQPPHDQIFE